MEQDIGFSSDGLGLKGVLHVPEGAIEPRPAIILCHGFGGSCRGAGHPELAQALQRAGYVVLRFDFRGCGQSEGARGSVICLEEVCDLRHAVDFLETRPEIDRERIGVIGASLGGSVAIDAAAKDKRLKFCAANGAIGKGERRFRFQYRDEAAWQAFLKRIEEAKRVKAETGRSAMLDRFDIVFIPESNRAGLPPGAVMAFTAETAMSMLDFNPEDVIAEIAPRPLLFIHPRVDAVVPCSETEAMAKAAGANCEAHIIESQNHFGSGDPTLIAITLDWLKRKAVG
ncbi:MAG: alpha/beta hydrolase [Stellaceae bacterium]